MKSLETKIKKMKLSSPLMTASGTSGHSNEEIEKLQKCPEILSALGAFVTKSVTLNSSKGNPEPRIVETRCGVINSIGLQNSGTKFFVQKELPRLVNLNLPVIVNVSAGTVKEFGKVASYLSNNDSSEIISGIEINVSCPNIKEGGVAFGTNPKLVEEIVKTIKKNVDNHITIITKLTPNVTDITVPARAAINGGTDALSMINTMRGMAIDICRGEPFLGNKTGGLSGPAIKPVGVFMVYECFRKISECKKRKIPIVGIGGISTWQDAMEYIMAGATAVGIGTAWFVNPEIFNKIHIEIKKFVDKQNKKLSDYIGKAHEK